MILVTLWFLVSYPDFDRSVFGGGELCFQKWCWQMTPVHLYSIVTLPRINYFPKRQFLDSRKSKTQNICVYVYSMLVSILEDSSDTFQQNLAFPHTHTCTYICMCVVFFFCEVVSVFKSKHTDYLDLLRICRWAYPLIFSLFTHH